MAVSNRAVVGQFALELDGEPNGYLISADGGTAVGTVVLEEAGPDHVQKKHLGAVSYEPITFEIGQDMGQGLRDWLQAAISGKPVRKNGAILEINANSQIVEAREFQNALITEITIPKLDGSSKENAYLTIKIAPETTRLRKSGGKPQTQKVTKSKRWLASNFRLEVDGMDCKGVIKIESFTLNWIVAESPIGERREYEIQPITANVPDLNITMNASHAQTWLDWHENFVIKGNCADDQEKKGVIVCLAPDLKTEILRIELFNLGIFRLAREHVAVGIEQIPRLVADLYCERMELKPGSSPL